MHVVHTRHVTRAHVDQDVGGWSDHRIELGMNFDRRFCQDRYSMSASSLRVCSGNLTILDNLSDKDDQLDERQYVADPRYPTFEPALPRRI